MKKIYKDIFKKSFVNAFIIIIVWRVILILFKLNIKFDAYTFFSILLFSYLLLMIKIYKLKVLRQWKYPLDEMLNKHQIIITNGITLSFLPIFWMVSFFIVYIFS
jgi:hypothetical protein